MSATKIKDIVLPALAKFWAKIQVQINELNEKLVTLSDNISNFENTKSDIVSSWLGDKLSLTTSNTWTTVVNAIKGVTLSGTATNAQVLSGSTYYNDSLTKQTGTMANNGALSKTFTPSTSKQIYTIPAGYTSGGTVTCNAYTPSSIVKYKVGTVAPSGTVNVNYSYDGADNLTGTYEGIYYVNINPGFTPLFAIAWIGTNSQCDFTFKYVLGSNSKFITNRYSSYYSGDQMYNITSSHSFTSSSVILPMHHLQSSMTCNYVVIGY